MSTVYRDVNSIQFHVTLALCPLTLAGMPMEWRPPGGGWVNVAANGSLWQANHNVIKADVTL